MSAVMRETGWAKINLALHVRQRRSDGYHELETIFAFVSEGDEITAEISDCDAFTLDGPFSEGLEADERNLVLQALHLLRARGGKGRIPPLHIRLTKNLPVAAGLGGGSADAAAMARLLRDHFLPEIGNVPLARLVASLGADVAACVGSEACVGTGVGADLEPLTGFQVSGLPVILVNPCEAVATGPVFKAWDQMDRGPLLLSNDMRGDLLAARNDLQRPAIAQCAAIADILVTLGGLKPWISRMSGSGATCFALFDSASERDAAAEFLRKYHPNWWVCAGELR